MGASTSTDPDVELTRHVTQEVKGWLLVGLQALLLVALVTLPWRTSPDSVWPPSVWLVIGGLLILAGVAFALLAMSHLSTALTPTPVPREGQTLRTRGAYRVVRHPIYSAILLASVGFTVAVGSWWQVGVTAALAVFFTLKSRWEDTMLAERFGDEWRAYACRTGALVPRLAKAPTPSAP